jgi:hypothetical protein
MVDPELPEPAATHAPSRQDAIAVFEAAYARLAEPAAAHFRALTRT